MEEPSGPVTGSPAPTWDGTSRAAAREIAEAAMRAYARPNLDAETWHREFSDYLTEQAAHDYQWVDPASIPATEVRGNVRISDAPSVYLAEVIVPTDVGQYLVLVSRVDGPWRVERVTPPDSPDVGGPETENA